MLTYADLDTAGVLTYAGVYWRMLTYAMLTYADVC
jgi:hypothetical protein